MFRKITIFSLMLMLTMVLQATEGSQKLKTVMAVDSVWMSGAAAQSGEFDQEFLHTMFDYYIKVPSFAYSVMPESDIDEFQTGAQKLKSINTKSMTNLMDETIVPLLLRVLSDPDIQKARLQVLRNAKDVGQLALEKSELYNLSPQLITQLLDAGYLYLPYISEIQKSYKKSTFKCIVEGGILWYRIHISTDGKARLILRQADFATGKARSDANKPKVFGTFRLGEDVIQTTPEQYAKYSALRNMMIDLMLDMRLMPEFDLGAQISEEFPNHKFSVGLGLREGVHLDDGFSIVQFREDSDGNLIKDKVGYARIINTADNRTLENRGTKSLAQAYYSKKNSDNAYLKEQRNSGLELSVSAGGRFGMKVPALAGTASPDLADPVYLLDKEINKALVLDAEFSYNMAPIWNIRQLYLDFEFALGYPVVDFSSGSEKTGAYMMSIYTGLSKKLWKGRNAVTFVVKGGYDRFAANATQDGKKLSLSANTLGAKFGADYTYMISPRWQLYAAADYKVNTKPFSSKLSYDGDDLSLSAGQSAAHDKINMGGTGIKLGIKRSLRYNPFNLFGWLNSFQKH